MKRAIILLAVMAANLANGQVMFAQMFGGETWTPASLNPIAWYQAENNALDSTGANNGTWSGTPSYTAGKIGLAASASQGNYVKLGNANTFISSENQPLSVSLWFNASSISASAAASANDNRIFAVASSGSASAIIITLGSSSKLSYYNSGDVQDVSATISTGQWYHFASSYDGSATRLYLNGVFCCAVTNTMPAGASGHNAVWGAGFSGSQPYLGATDDLLIFKRAITAEEITKLYNESINKNGKAW